MMTTCYSSPALRVPTNLEEASKPRVGEVVSLTLFEMLSSKVEFGLFFQNESLIILVVGLIAAILKMTRQHQINKDEDQTIDEN